MPADAFRDVREWCARIGGFVAHVGDTTLPYFLAHGGFVWLDQCHIIWHGQHMNKPAVNEITSKLDPDAVQRRLGVRERSLRLARERGMFPANWYPAIKSMCDDAGLRCPMDAFNWKSPTEQSSATKAGNGRESVQGAGR